jgi:hypothetical protein
MSRGTHAGGYLLTKTTIVLTLTMAALLARARPAAAQGQPDPGGTAFLNINLGAQPPPRTVATSESFLLYDDAQRHVRAVAPLRVSRRALRPERCGVSTHSRNHLPARLYRCPAQAAVERLHGCRVAPFFEP